MEHSRQGNLRALALENGVTIVAGDATLYMQRLVVYDATGHPLQALWAMACGLAHVLDGDDPWALAEWLFAGDYRVPRRPARIVA